MTLETRDTFPTDPAPGADLPPDLAALVGSRLCHDLISPLGAIGNGVELLAMSGPPSPELSLISESVAAANAKIKFFRIAFGQAGSEQRLGRNEIAGVLAEICAGGRLKYRWEVLGDQPRAVVKLVFLALLCLEQALPWGGEIVISEEDGCWHLRAETKRTKPDEALWLGLARGNAQVSPAQVQFALLPREVSVQGRALTWEIDEAHAEMRF